MMLLHLNSQNTLLILNLTYRNSAEQLFQIMVDYFVLVEDTKITSAVSGCSNILKSKGCWSIVQT